MEKYLLFADGQSSHTLKWAKEVNKYFDLYLLTFSRFREDFFDFFDHNKLISLGMTLNVTGGNYIVLRQIPAIIKIVNSIKPSILNAHYITSYGFIAALLKKFTSFNGKIVLSAWGSDILVTPYKALSYKKIIQFSLKQADVITSDSKFMSEKIKELSEKNALTFPFGLESFDEKVLYEDKDPYLIFSNRALGSNYNIDNVIKFFQIQLSHEQKYKLVIANEGPEKENLKRMVKYLNIEDKVSFVGFLTQKEQNAMYKKSQYFISIPTSDSTSVSLLEAMAYGCVPIVADIPANREWITEGSNGIFYSKDINLLSHTKNNERIFVLNREIIKTKALWENNILEYIEELDK